ncbi:MAG: hypothetical protein M1835_004178, partial [Candelina submexicana]
GADFRDGSVASATGWCKSFEIFEVLVEKRWDVNTLSLLDTPVLGTVLKDPELVKWFLAHGADPNFGKSGLILNLAACISTVSIFKILLQHGADISQSLPLHQAAAAPDDAGRIEMLAFLIDEMKLDVDADDWAKGLFRRLGTPLHYAIESGGIEKAKFLVKKGASLDIRNSRGRTPLEQAERTACGELFELFRGMKDR